MFESKLNSGAQAYDEASREAGPIHTTMWRVMIYRIFIWYPMYAWQVSSTKH